jgi:hypothetical protein
MRQTVFAVLWSGQISQLAFLTGSQTFSLACGLRDILNYFDTG